QGQAGQHGDDREDPAAGPGARPGGVEEDVLCGHRATAARLLSQLKKKPVGSVRIRNPIANPMNVGMTGATPWSNMSFICRDASCTPSPATEAIVVFLVSAMSTLPSGPTTLRSACGSTISRRFCVKVRPSERAASTWPSGTVFTPERSDSETKQAV